MDKIEVRIHAGDSSTIGFIRWSRLAKHLRASGELKSNEVIEVVTATESGIKYTVKVLDRRPYQHLVDLTRHDS